MMTEPTNTLPEPEEATIQRILEQMPKYCDGPYNCPYYLECWEINRCLLDEEAERIIAEDKEKEGKE